MHSTSEPSILYFGTPVVLLTTANADGSTNIAPISSVFWLGWRCVIGISALSKTTENLQRTGECVLNLPSVENAEAVNQLALTTGTCPVPQGKALKGYRYAPDKFAISGLHPLRASMVSPSRIAECPVHLEAVVENAHALAQDDESQRGRLLTFELRILRVHLDESIRDEQKQDHVDPDKWRPLIMSFQKFYGLGPQIRGSRLATIPEELYRSADIARAREERAAVC